MWTIFILTICYLTVAVTEGRPQDHAAILVDTINGPDEFGNFDFRYETGDGIFHEARGRNNGDGIVRVQGRYSYTSPEGEMVEVAYTGDEHGYRAVGPLVPASSRVSGLVASERAAQGPFSREAAENSNPENENGSQTVRPPPEPASTDKPSAPEGLPSSVGIRIKPSAVRRTAGEKAG
ncbi:flexible cuticle protein 12 [Hyalella azteca]|uniref:Flexible cuticle protein 12 n=1 Tax=Hyalella azteca TaxID=294128 RepID=A0A8B7NT82_HYAAZ|nr:flexible cuticle protein 12 [Hyalella azteca]